MKISQLAQATTVNDDDVFPVVQGDETKKITAKALLANQPTDVVIDDENNMHLMAGDKPVGEGVPLPYVDQTYNPTSKNGQSGFAVAEATKAVIDFTKTTFANALKGSVSGEIISVDDVSPIPHTMNLSVQGDDLSAVNVKVCGKNLFDLQNSQGFYSTYGNITSEIVDDSIIVTCTVASRGGYLELGTFPAGTYYISTSEKISVQNNGVSIAQTPCKVTITETSKLFLYKGLSSSNSPWTISNIQVEIGEEQTDYETPKVLTYTPNADGSVDGVVSVSPNMTVYTETDGVTVNCEYNKDTNKVIENLVNAIISLGGNV